MRFLLRARLALGYWGGGRLQLKQKVIGGMGKDPCRLLKRLIPDILVITILIVIIIKMYRDQMMLPNLPT